MAAIVSQIAALAPLRTTRRSVARRAVVSNGTTAKVSARALWLPGAEVPSYLNGSLPGDYGFDPLKLGEVPANLARFREAELIHCRFAMLGVAGVLAVEALGFGNWIDAQQWVNQAGGHATWFGVTNPLSLAQLMVLEFALMGFVESRRADEKDPEKRCYPGGAFDPAGFSKDANGLKSMKVKELANGRLAMLAFLGFVAQYDATHTGPLANLSAHLSDPWIQNLSINGVSLPNCLGYCS